MNTYTKHCANTKSRIIDDGKQSDLHKTTIAAHCQRENENENEKQSMDIKRNTLFIADNQAKLLNDTENNDEEVNGRNSNNDIYNNDGHTLTKLILAPSKHVHLIKTIYYGFVLFCIILNENIQFIDRNNNVKVKRSVNVDVSRKRRQFIINDVQRNCLPVICYRFHVKCAKYKTILLSCVNYLNSFYKNWLSRYINHWHRTNKFLCANIRIYLNDQCMSNALMTTNTIDSVHICYYRHCWHCNKYNAIQLYLTYYRKFVQINSIANHCPYRHKNVQNHWWSMYCEQNYEQNIYQQNIRQYVGLVFAVPPKDEAHNSCRKIASTLIIRQKKSCYSMSTHFSTADTITATTISKKSTGNNSNSISNNNNNISIGATISTVIKYNPVKYFRKNFCWFFLVLFICAPFSSAALHNPKYSANVVKTKYGPLRGIIVRTHPTVEAYLGVPYATPPVGSLR